MNGAGFPAHFVKFCVSCYLQHAMNMADGHLEKHAHDEGFAVKLISGASGQFDVTLDDEWLYSKQESAGFQLLRILNQGCPIQK
ncbi:MAG: Rdx family protein [Conexivisphaerales archaeon]